MATNLRLEPDAESAVRAEAARTGQSQQAIIRDAVDRHLGLRGAPSPSTAVEGLLASQVILPARSAYRELDAIVHLPRGVSTEDLLDRSERF